MTKKTGIILLVFIIVSSMLLNAAPPETPPPAPAAEKKSKTTPGKDDGEGAAFVEQEGSEFEGEKRMKAAPLVVGAAIVIVAAAIYFVAIKKPHKDQTMLQVNSVPAGAMIYLDGFDRGKLTNYTFSNLTPGAHNVKLTKSGYEDFIANVSIRKDQTVVVNATLTPAL